MQFTVKDVKEVGNARFHDKVINIKNVWCWVFAIVLFIVLVLSQNYYNYKSNDQSIMSYRSDSGDWITFSTNYGGAIMQYAFDGNILKNYGEYVEFNGVKYTPHDVATIKSGSFSSYMYHYRKYIMWPSFVILALIGYFVYYNPRKKYIKQVLDEYEKEGNK